MKNCLLLLFVLSIFYSKGQTTFQKLYGDTNTNDFADGYCISTDGNYMIAGVTGNYPNFTPFLMKVDALGNSIWKKGYPGLDYFSSITATLDGGFVIAGHSDSLSTHLEVSILKTDSLGNALWCKKFDATPSHNYSMNLFQNQQGEFIITGHGYDSFFQNSYAFVFKIDYAGNLLWDKKIEQAGSAGILFKHASLTIDDGLVVTGRSFQNNTHKLFLMKIDASGQISWTRLYGSEFWGSVTLQTLDGGFITSGVGYSTNIPFGYLLIKSDSMGNFQWCKIFSDAVGYPYLAVDNSGNYVIAGTRQDAFSDSANIYMIKTNSIGDTIWTRFYEIDPMLGYRGEGTRGFFKTPNDEYFVGASADKIQPDQTDIFLLKTDANGLAGCNQVNRQITIESLTLVTDTSNNFISGITTSNINISSIPYQFSDTPLCAFDFINELDDEILIDVFPNPATNHFSINTSNFSDVELLLEIKDLIGRTIFQKKISGVRSIEVDVSDLTKGIYVVTLSGKNGIGKKIFCKQ